MIDIPYKVQRERQIKEEKEKLIEKNKKIEEERKQNRDSDKQETPYIYQIGTHGNESLAIRYGIANLEKKIKEYWYHAKGGEKIRNKDRDEVYFEPSSKIELKKVKKVGENMYEVLLTNYKDRRAKVVIEVGTEYVKTFYPMNESWFAKHAELEKTLKGNGTFTLKELSTFHVQKTVNL